MGTENWPSLIARSLAPIEPLLIGGAAASAFGGPARVGTLSGSPATTTGATGFESGVGVGSAGSNNPATSDLPARTPAATSRAVGGGSFSATFGTAKRAGGRSTGAPEPTNA